LLKTSIYIQIVIRWASIHRLSICIIDLPTTDKINFFWHQYTIDAVHSFTFLRRTIENCKIFKITVVKTSLLPCSMYGMWPKLIVLTTHEREWRDPVVGLWTYLNKVVTIFYIKLPLDVQCACSIATCASPGCLLFIHHTVLPDVSILQPPVLRLAWICLFYGILCCP
jgi:hypothetical protein